MPRPPLQMLDFWLASLLGQKYSVLFAAVVADVDYDDDSVRSHQSHHPDLGITIMHIDG